MIILQIRYHYHYHGNPGESEVGIRPGACKRANLLWIRLCSLRRRR